MDFFEGTLNMRLTWLKTKICDPDSTFCTLLPNPSDKCCYCTVYIKFAMLLMSLWCMRMSMVK